jgi:hypothetical protein
MKVQTEARRKGAKNTKHAKNMGITAAIDMWRFNVHLKGRIESPLRPLRTLRLCVELIFRLLTFTAHRLRHGRTAALHLTRPQWLTYLDRAAARSKLASKWMVGHIRNASLRGVTPRHFSSVLFTL